MVENKTKYYIEHFIKNSDNVRKKTLGDNQLFHKIDHLSAFFHNLVTSIKIKWNEQGNKKLNDYSEIIIEECFLETAKECENFICLLLNGFYDGAVKSLRHILENFVVHYYFSMLEKNGNLKRYYVKKAEFYKLQEQLTEEEVKEIKRYEREKTLPLGQIPTYKADSFFSWKLGKRYLKGYDFLKNKANLVYFPSFKEDCLELIFKQNNFQKEEVKRLNLKQEITDLYKDFSKIVHNRGSISKYKTSSSFLNGFYKKEDLEKSIELYKKIEEIISIMLLFGDFPNFDKNSFTYIEKYRKLKDEIEKQFSA